MIDDWFTKILFFFFFFKKASIYPKIRGNSFNRVITIGWNFISEKIS